MRGRPKIVWVLDWEMATVGDALANLGTTFALWIQRDDTAELWTVWSSPTSSPGRLTRSAFIEAYVKYSGRVANPLFYYAFGLFNLAIIYQQIYVRYRRDLTRDQGFAPFYSTVSALVH